MSQATRQYTTTYSIWLEEVARGERPDATIEEMDAARHALARRADRLSNRGGRLERADLQRRYDAIVARLLAAGWR